MLKLLLSIETTTGWIITLQIGKIKYISISKLKQENEV